MRINKVTFINDFNCIKKDTVIDFSGTDNYCALVGLNGSGKSTVIDYLFSTLFQYHSNDKQIFEKISIGDKDTCFDEMIPTIPQYVVFNYSGESKYGTKIRNRRDIITSQFDYKIWYFASFVLQIINDPIIEQYQLKSEKLELYIKDYSNTYKDTRESFVILSHIFNDMIGINNINVDRETFTKIGLKCYFRYVIDAYIREAYELLHSKKSPINGRLIDLYENLRSLSEGEKKLLVLKLIMYLADNDTLVLLDEPDANLDIQKKRELFEMIQSCKGQVILTTHDPIMTNWMKDHLVFMGNGHQISRTIPNAIKELSEGELSYQETLFILSESKHFVFAEGKTDIAFIKKAIEKLDYAKRFENITFLSLGSSGAVEDKYYTTIAELLPKDTKKVLFLFDADKGGFDGKKQISNIINDYNDIFQKQVELDNKKIKLEETTDEMGKKQLKEGIKDLEYQIDKIRKVAFDPNKLLTYYFYNNDDDFDTKDLNKWFYLEDYFPQKTYPEKCQIKIFDIQTEYGYDPKDDIIRFSHLLALDKKCQFAAKQIKDYLKDNLHKIEDKEDFEGFRPLLEKILEKMELK